VKTNLNITVDTKILERFNQVKGEQKISHLVQFWLTQFLDNKKEFGPISAKPPMKKHPPTKEKEGVSS